MGKGHRTPQQAPVDRAPDAGPVAAGGDSLNAGSLAALAGAGASPLSRYGNAAVASAIGAAAPSPWEQPGPHNLLYNGGSAINPTAARTAEVMGTMGSAVDTASALAGHNSPLPAAFGPLMGTVKCATGEDPLTTSLGGHVTHCATKEAANYAIDTAMDGHPLAMMDKLTSGLKAAYPKDLGVQSGATMAESFNPVTNAKNGVAGTMDASLALGSMAEGNHALAFQQNDKVVDNQVRGKQGGVIQGLSIMRDMAMDPKRTSNALMSKDAENGGYGPLVQLGHKIADHDPYARKTGPNTKEYRSTEEANAALAGPAMLARAMKWLGVY